MRRHHPWSCPESFILITRPPLILATTCPGVVSGALLQIADDFRLSEWQQEAVVSITTVGAVCGSLVGGSANESLGRRPVILASSLVFTVGAVVMAAASNLEVRGLAA